MAKESERQAGNWLRSYLEYTREAESPDSYHLFIGIHTLASVARRNVFLDQGLYVLFPNVYIALVGPPGRTGKSTALHMGSSLLYEVPNIKFGPNACSREDLIRKMAESKLDNVCAMTISSSEFSSLIDVSGILMFQFLTDIYDCNYTPPKGWVYSTKNAGKDVIVNPVLNMIVGTTPDYLADSMPSNVVGHGFTARLIIVFEEYERLINPRPKPSDEALRQALINDLNHISTIRGEFQWADEAAQKLYDDYYHSLYKGPPTDYRLEGFHWRKKIHVLKLAMLLSLAENDSLLLTAADIQAAIDMIAAIEPQMGRAFSAVGKYEHASDLERIAAMVCASPEGIALQEIFSRNYHAGDYKELNNIITMLDAMRAIKIINRGGQEWVVPGPAGAMFNGRGQR